MELDAFNGQGIGWGSAIYHIDECKMCYITVLCANLGYLRKKQFQDFIEYE